MSKYREVSANMNFVEREKETERFWSENRIFEKSVEQREARPFTPSTMARPRPTASPISGIWRPGPLRICSPGITP